MKKLIALLLVINLALFGYFNFAPVLAKPAKLPVAENNLADITLLSPTEIAALPVKPAVVIPTTGPIKP